MAGISTSSTNTTSRTAEPNANYTPALASLTILFFMMGFITCLNDTLIPYLKNAFTLSYAEAMLVQFCFFTAYMVMSIPSGWIIKRLGYKQGMILGFIGAGIGCALFYPAAETKLYGVFLGALFILASGITLLQVAANPYVAVLGPSETSSSRLTLTQAFNSLGTTVAPFFGSQLILFNMQKAEAGQTLTPEQITGNLEKVQLPYLGIAIALIVIAAALFMLKLPNIQDQNSEKSKSGSAWQYSHLMLGAIGIFTYVGAEVAIGSLLTNFMAEKDIAGLSEHEANRYLSFYWGGAMVGRFIGAGVLQKMRPGYVLAFNSVAAIVLVSASMFFRGEVAMWSLLAVGLCNSIMFATIFTLAVKGLGVHTEQGSGILCTAIVGGAAIPLLQGFLVDEIGMRFSFILPIICYLYIAWYGVKGHVPQQEQQA